MLNVVQKPYRQITSLAMAKAIYGLRLGGRVTVFQLYLPLSWPLFFLGHDFKWRVSVIVTVGDLVSPIDSLSLCRSPSSLSTTSCRQPYHPATTITICEDEYTYTHMVVVSQDQSTKVWVKKHIHYTCREAISSKAHNSNTLSVYDTHPWRGWNQPRLNLHMCVGGELFG